MRMDPDEIPSLFHRGLSRALGTSSELDAELLDEIRPAAAYCGLIYDSSKSYSGSNRHGLAAVSAFFDVR